MKKTILTTLLLVVAVLMVIAQGTACLLYTSDAADE